MMSVNRSSTTRRRRRHLFTLESANRALPLVRAIVSDLARLSQNVADRRQRVSHLLVGRELQSGDPYAEELALVGDDLRRDTARIEEYVAELEQLGVVVRNGPLGLVDFPSEMDGRPVFLCWRLGEPEVLYWHAPDSGFTDRQPLTADVGSDLGAEADRSS